MPRKSSFKQDHDVVSCYVSLTPLSTDLSKKKTEGMASHGSIEESQTRRPARAAKLKCLQQLPMLVKEEFDKESKPKDCEIEKSKCNVGEYNEHRLEKRRLYEMKRKANRSAEEHRQYLEKARLYEFNKKINETYEQRRLRLEKNRVRRLKCKEKTSEDILNQRREKERVYRLQRRANETPEQRNRRLERSRKYAAKHKAGESIEQRERRLEKDRQRRLRQKVEQSTANETPEEREQRLEKRLQQRLKLKEGETPEQREKRLQRDRQRRLKRKEKSINTKCTLCQNRLGLAENALERTKCENELCVNNYGPNQEVSFVENKQFESRHICELSNRNDSYLGQLDVLKQETSKGDETTNLEHDFLTAIKTEPCYQGYDQCYITASESIAYSEPNMIYEIDSLDSISSKEKKLGILDEGYKVEKALKIEKDIEDEDIQRITFNETSKSIVDSSTCDDLKQHRKKDIDANKVELTEQNIIITSNGVITDVTTHLDGEYEIERVFKMEIDIESEGIQHIPHNRIPTVTDSDKVKDIQSCKLSNFIQTSLKHENENGHNLSTPNNSNSYQQNRPIDGNQKNRGPTLATLLSLPARDPQVPSIQQLIKTVSESARKHKKQETLRQQNMLRLKKNEEEIRRKAEKYQQRLEKIRQRRTQQLAKETAEQRERRLEKQRQYEIKKMANETDEQRKRRLERQKEYDTKRKANVTAEEHQRYLEKRRERKRNARENRNILNQNLETQKSLETQQKNITETKVKTERYTEKSELSDVDTAVSSEDILDRIKIIATETISMKAEPSEI